jgi:hypothetical protein
VICEEARLHIGAEPDASTAGLREHLEGCSACRSYQAKMAALEADLHKAFALGPALPRRTVRRRTQAKAPAPRSRAWAMAASVLVALVGGVALWSARAPESLAREIGFHLALEPDAWTAPQTISLQDVNALLGPSHVALAADQDQVIFARQCWVHRELAPHLVVRTTEGPVAVIILPGVPVKAPQTFHENGFTGVLLPAPRGSIAVLTQKDEIGAEVARRLSQAVRWLPDGPGAG